MTSHQPGQCCTIGIKHVGEPTGKIITLANRWDAYVASPSDKPKDAALLLLPDVMGIWTNSQLIADQFAANGYTCVIPDLFNGDALPLNRPPGFDLKTWINQGSDGENPHTPPYVDPIVEAAIDTIKGQLGFSKVGALGYCLGAKYAIRHSKAGATNVSFIAHPSAVEEDELQGIGGPLSIAAAEKDQVFTPEKRHRSEEILKETGEPYQVTLYSGVGHGFAVRGDPSIQIQKFAKEQAFFQALTWFNTWLD